jgi:hypothetical protein
MFESHLILLSQKNRIFEIIQVNNIPTDQFTWVERPSNFDSRITVSALLHKPSGFYFQFDFYQGAHYCLFSPGENQQTQSEFCGDWSNQIGIFAFWLQYLMREVQAPDLWNAILNEKVLSEFSYDKNENTEFSSEEISRIQKNLEEIKQYLISAQSFSPNQLRYLDANFDYLQDAATRMGRKDWIIIVVGTLTNIAITLALNSDISRKLFHIAGLLLKWVIGFPLLG